MRQNLLNVVLLAAVIGSVAGGCASKDKGEKASKKDLFRPESEPRDLHYYVNAQAAAGAREHGMLGDPHFNGAKLNSLGREQLELMRYERPSDGPMFVYVNLPKGELATARQKQVAAYLNESGMIPADFQVKEGANASAAVPAAPYIYRMYRIESTSPPAPGVAPAAQTYGQEKK